MSHHRKFVATTQMLEAAVAALIARAGLAVDDAERLRQAGRQIEQFPAGALIDQAAGADQRRLIVSGWAYEARLLPDARRQIFSFLLPGDLLPKRAGRRAPCALFALTLLNCVELGSAVLEDGHGKPSSLAEALTRATAAQTDRKYDALLRLGQYTAQERLIHLLLELGDRLKAAGLADGETFRVPLTQEHLADALGLSLVHVNRVLRQLRLDGLMNVRGGVVRLLQPSQLLLLASGGGGSVLVAARNAHGANGGDQFPL